MDSWLTLIASIVIAGIFLLGLLTFYGDLIDHSNEKLYELLTQESAASFMEIIDHDLRRMGNGLSYPSQTIVSMGSSQITFLADIDNDNTVDTVGYSTSLPSAATSTSNPDDIILYRLINSDSTINTPAGVTNFELHFYDKSKNITADPMAVRMIDVSLTLESLYPADTTYVRALWEKRITPQNFVRITNKDF
jgi:hypothetical protein